jgi:hypothetical protein
MRTYISFSASGIFVISAFLVASASCVRSSSPQQASTVIAADRIKIKSLVYGVTSVYDETGYLYEKIEDVYSAGFYPYASVLKPEYPEGRFELAIRGYDDPSQMHDDEYRRMHDDGYRQIIGALSVGGVKRNLSFFPNQKIPPEIEARRRVSFISSGQPEIEKMVSRLSQEITDINRKYGNVSQARKSRLIAHPLPNEDYRAYIKRMFGPTFLVDPWGTQIALYKDQKTQWVVSAGADTRFDTSDDIRAQLR